MAITQRQVGVGVGGASIGFVGAEAIQHAQEAELISDRTGRIIAGTLAAGSVGVTAATLAGVGPLSTDGAALAAGIGLGSSVWYVGREASIAPRISVALPEEINVVDPLVTAGVVTLTGLAVATVTNGVL